MAHIIAAIVIIAIVCIVMWLAGRILSGTRSPFYSPDYGDDDPHLIESGRDIRETKSELRARLDAEREGMVA